MKKALLSIIIVLASIQLFAQQWVACGRQTPAAPKVNVVSDTGQSVELCVSFGGFFKEAVTTPQGEQYLINAPKMASMLVEGAPDLPLYAVPVLIGEREEMELSVKDVKYQDIEGMEVAPSKGTLSRQIDPATVPYTYGEMYSKNAFWPDNQAELDRPYILRDFRGQNVLVYPFAFNPVTKVLRVYTQLTLVMRPTGKEGENAQSRLRASHKLAREADALYARRFVNYRERAAKYNFIADVGEMLVICPEQYMEAMQPFVDWKNQSGRPTTMVSLTEAGGNNVEAIKSYIRSHYENPDENLCYVLVVGDYADVTPKARNGGCSDIYWGQLDGNDNYPELFVGRFSVESVADVQNHVSKVIYYERDITADASWLSHGIGIGSTEGEGSGHNGGESDYVHMDYIRDTLLHYTYTDVSQHYRGVGVGTNAAMLSADFNAGAGICNYCNHGSVIGWYVGNFDISNVDALVNDYKWPFIWSTACLNGQFYNTCFAEAWMRATNDNTGAPTGAIGGMFSWTSQPWQEPMTGQDEMVDVLCEWRSPDQYHHTLGGASLNGNMKILDLHPSDQGLTHNTWILFGDPSLMVRTAQPTAMNLIVQPEVILLGQTSLRLTADVDYATATLSFNGEVLACAPVVNGECVLNFPEQTETGTALLVVTAFNKVTEAREIEIIPATGAYLTYDSFSIDDDNHQADYGDTVNLSVAVRNIGNQTANNVQVSLTTDSPYVTVTHGSGVIPAIGPMTSYTLSNTFEIAVNEHITDGVQAEFSLSCTAEGQTWTNHFRVPLHAPAFVISEFRPAANVNPGETGILLVGVRNIGSSDAHNATIQLYSSSSDLVINPVEYTLGELPAGQEAVAQASFSSSAGVPVGSTYEVYYQMDAAPYALSGTDMLSIGPVRETFESGDFSAYPWETLGGAHWTIDNSTAHTGTYSARSGAITHVNVTTLQIKMEVAQNGEISFYKRISSEAGKDKLTFYIDNVAKAEWSGEVDWSREVFAVNAGSHKFKWIYQKDSNGSYGDDCCWIDDVQFPSVQTVTFMPAVELEAEVVENRVTLSWQANDPEHDYIIRRDGLPVATQHATTFSELVNLGTFTYSVTPINNDGQQGLPAFATVQVTVLGIDSIESTLRVYPNPVRNYLNISYERPFSYTLYSPLGQRILEGSATGEAHVYCGQLTQGVYVLHINADDRVTKRKIIVE